jgi:translation initiation factor IF-2
VVHTNSDGEEKSITFIDTPGHAAFSDMRQRGASIADIAILIVSAEDGVKAQTKEALDIIKKSKVPFVVAINKIDKPHANPERVKTELMEHEIFLEGFGGDVPYAEVSAKAGTNVSDLLDTILLVAEIEEFTGDPTQPATGFVIESHMDQKRGTSATLIIKNGSVKKGQFIVVDKSTASTRIMEDFQSKNLDKAQFSSPVTIVGFNTLPKAGSTFQTFDTKKDAEKAMQEFHSLAKKIEEVKEMIQLKDDQALIPIILKTDVAGTSEAIESEIAKLTTDNVIFKIIKTGVGDINESDVQVAIGDPTTIILGFHVKEDKKIAGMNEADMVTIKTFDIIYKMLEWLEEERDRRKPQREVEVVTGAGKLLKTFSSRKNNHVAGGRMTEGVLKVGNRVRIMRRDTEIDRGKITGIQQAKAEVKEVKEGEFGIMIESSLPPAVGDHIEAFEARLQ